MSKRRKKNPPELKLTSIVKSMIGIHITGNITPPTWYSYIVKPRTLKAKKDKADLIAITILSDIWYWYTPTEVRDEKTGRILGYKDKFSADMLQRSHKYYMDMLNLGKDQIINAERNLERLNLIKRHSRDIVTKNGITITGVVYLEPIVKNILKITYPEDYNYNISLLEDPPVKKQGGPCKKTGGSLQKNRGVPVKLQGGPCNFTGHTKNTTETLTKNTTTTLSSSFFSLPKRVIETLPVHYQKSEGILKILDTFLKEGFDETYIIKEIEYVNKRERLGKILIGYPGYLKKALNKGFGNKSPEEPPSFTPQSSKSQKTQADRAREEQIKKDRDIQIWAEEIDREIESLDTTSIKKLDEYTVQNLSKTEKIRYVKAKKDIKNCILKRKRRDFFKEWLKENQLPN